MTEHHFPTAESPDCGHAPARGAFDAASPAPDTDPGRHLGGSGHLDLGGGTDDGWATLLAAGSCRP